MRWTSQAAAGLLAIALVGCSGGRNRTTGTVGGGNETGAVTDTGGMGATPMDTAMTGMQHDTAMTGARHDTGMTGAQPDTAAAPRRANADSAGGATPRDQTQSGVTSDSGKSTLGPGATRTRPDQGQPVTSKGDTLNPGVDSAR